MASVKQQAQKLKKHGRNGDTVLAHISPQEDKFLTQLGGGRKSKNPKTGLPEHFFGIDDAIIGSMILSAGIGAATSAIQGQNPLRGALMGGLTGALTHGIGGMFGGAGAGAAGAAAGAAGATSAAAPIQGLGEIAMTDLAAPTAAEVAAQAAEPSFADMMIGKAKDFIKSPAGMITGIGAIGGLMDDGGKKQQKKMQEELDKLREKDKDYPVLPPLNRKMAYADGGEAKKDDEDYVDRVYSSAYGGGNSNTGALEDLYADPYLFRGYTQDATGKQTELPPSYIPMNTVYNLPNIDDALKNVQGDIASQIKSGVEQYGNNMLSRMPGLLGIGTPGATNSGAGIGSTAEVNNFPAESQTNKPAAKANLKIVSYTPPTTQNAWMKGGGQQIPGQLVLSDGRVIPLTGTGGMSSSDPSNTAAIFASLSGINGKSLDDSLAGADGGLAWKNHVNYYAPQYAGAGTYRDVLSKMFPDMGFATGGHVSGIGGGKDDMIPAQLSDGEHVVTADEVSMLGDGSNREGQQKMYKFRQNIRKHKTGKNRQMPRAKQAEAYAGIGGA